LKQRFFFNQNRKEALTKINKKQELLAVQGFFPKKSIVRK